ncbi:N-6 DNA Methylase [compost metagenome]
MAPNLFYGAGIPACILILRKQKPVARKGQIMIINGAEHFVEGKAQNHLSEGNVETLAKAYGDFADAERLARVVPVSEIEANDFNLNISRYVHLGAEAEEVDVTAEVEQLVALQAERDAAEARMMGFLRELGYVA